AEHDGVRPARLHVQAPEADRRRPEPRGLRALRARQALLDRLGAQHAPALRGAPRLRSRLPADPRPPLPADGRRWPLPLVARADAPELDDPGRAADRRGLRSAGPLAVVDRKSTRLN